MLKVTDKTTDPRVMFVELNPGDLFKGSSVCLKIHETASADPGISWWNAIDLQNNCLIYVAPTSKVLSIHAELIVSDKEEY